jgi:hypothetical protein
MTCCLSVSPVGGNQTEKKPAKDRTTVLFGANLLGRAVEHAGANFSDYVRDLVESDLDRRTPKALDADILTTLATRLCGERVGEKVHAVLANIDQRDLLELILRDIAQRGALLKWPSVQQLLTPPAPHPINDVEPAAALARKRKSG